MRFWDREREVEDLKAYFESEPNAILFLYGPKSSGKTTVLKEAVNRLRKEKKALFFEQYRVLWFDLRAKMISSYENVVDMLFAGRDEYVEERVEEERLKSGVEPVVAVEQRLYTRIRERKIDPFEWLEGEMKRGSKRVVVVFDELQRLKWVYMNGEGQRPVVNELFNFFVRITKVEHLAHVVWQRLTLSSSRRYTKTLRFRSVRNTSYWTILTRR